MPALTETQVLLRKQERLVRRVISDHNKLIRLIEDVRARVALQERLSHQARGDKQQRPAGPVEPASR